MAIDYGFETRDLRWRATSTQVGTITFTNKGTEDLVIEVPAPLAATADDFTWPAQSWLVVKGIGSNGAKSHFTRTVAPPTPRTGLGLRTATILFRVRDASGNVLEERPFLLRNDAVPRITNGDMAVTMFTFNPTGPDLTGDVEGEFVDLTNLTNRTLDLSGSSLFQLTFPGSVPGQPVRPPQSSRLVEFNPDQSRQDFMNDCLLPPRATLRVLTRRPYSTELPATVPDYRQRLYLGLGNPVWNNTGDRCTLTNDFGDLVCSQGYGTQANTGQNGPQPPVPNPPIPTPPVLTPPGQRQTVLLPTPFFVFANMDADFPAIFDIEDGDLVTITTNEAALIAAWTARAATPTGTVRLDPAGPRILPSGSRLAAFFATWIDPPLLGAADNEFWLPTAPAGALIGKLGGNQHFLVGQGTSFVATLNATTPLRLGINDIPDQYWNNDGVFVATVSVRR